MTTTGKVYRPSGDLYSEHTRLNPRHSDGLYRVDRRLGPLQAAAEDLLDAMGACDTLGGHLRPWVLFGRRVYGYRGTRVAVSARQLTILKGCGAPERVLAAVRALISELTLWTGLRRGGIRG